MIRVEARHKIQDRAADDAFISGSIQDRCNNQETYARLKRGIKGPDEVAFLPPQGELLLRDTLHHTSISDNILMYPRRPNDGALET